MSLTTLKKKSYRYLNKISENSSISDDFLDEEHLGFSINGGMRNQGWIGHDSRGRYLSRTVFKGNQPVGHGGKYGLYNNKILSNKISNFNNSSIIKRSTMNTNGYLSISVKHPTNVFYFNCNLCKVNTNWVKRFCPLEHSQSTYINNKSLKHICETTPRPVCIYTINTTKNKTDFSCANKNTISRAYCKYGYYNIGNKRKYITRFFKDVNVAVSQSKYIKTNLMIKKNLPTPPCLQPFPMKLNHSTGCNINFFTPEEAIKAGLLPKDWMACTSCHQLGCPKDKDYIYDSITKTYQKISMNIDLTSNTPINTKEQTEEENYNNYIKTLPVIMPILFSNWNSNGPINIQFNKTKQFIFDSNNGLGKQCGFISVKWGEPLIYLKNDNENMINVGNYIQQQSELNKFYNLQDVGIFGENSDIIITIATNSYNAITIRDDYRSQVLMSIDGGLSWNNLSVSSTFKDDNSLSFSYYDEPNSNFSSRLVSSLSVSEFDNNIATILVTCLESYPDNKRSDALICNNVSKETNIISWNKLTTNDQSNYTENCITGAISYNYNKHYELIKNFDKTYIALLKAGQNTYVDGFGFYISELIKTNDVYKCEEWHIVPINDTIINLNNKNIMWSDVAFNKTNPYELIAGSINGENLLGGIFIVNTEQFFNSDANIFIKTFIDTTRTFISTSIEYDINLKDVFFNILSTKATVENPQITKSSILIGKFQSENDFIEYNYNDNNPDDVNCHNLNY